MSSKILENLILGTKLVFVPMSFVGEINKLKQSDNSNDRIRGQYWSPIAKLAEFEKAMAYALFTTGLYNYFN